VPDTVSGRVKYGALWFFSWQNEPWPSEGALPGHLIFVMWRIKVRLTLYPFDINSSTAEFDSNPQLQGNVYDRFKRLALFLKSQNRGTVVAAAVAVQQLADLHGCTVRYIKAPTAKRCDIVVVESKKEDA
jgi:hypothetical protein